MTELAQRYNRYGWAMAIRNLSLSGALAALGLGLTALATESHEIGVAGLAGGLLAMLLAAGAHHVAEHWADPD